jgi:hypothetical protein
VSYADINPFVELFGSNKDTARALLSGTPPQPTPTVTPPASNPVVDNGSSIKPKIRTVKYCKRKFRKAPRKLRLCLKKLRNRV